MRDKRVAAAVIAALMLFLGACSNPDSANVSVGPVPTTPPLAIPPVFGQPEQAGAPVATSAPVAEPVEATAASELPTSEPTALPAPTTIQATAVPATAVPVATPTAVPAPTPIPATAVPDTAAPATQVTPVPAAPQGSTVSLGDFDVVNLVTGATQNIAELSPSGPTMLWFWAPH